MKMKNKRRLMTLLLCLLFISGCGKPQDSFEIRDIGLTLLFPESWKGNYTMVKDVDGSYTFYHPETRASSMEWSNSGEPDGGALFHLASYDEPMTEDEFLEKGLDYTAYKYIAVIQGKTYILYHASDVQYHPEDEKQTSIYQQMLSEVDEIQFELAESGQAEESGNPYSDVIAGLGDEDAYAFLVMDYEYQALVTTDRTYGAGGEEQAAVYCDVYYVVNHEAKSLGKVLSDGAAHPITFSKDGIFAASGHLVEKYGISEEGELYLKKAVYETFDESGNAEYTQISNGEGSKATETDYSALSEEYARSQTVHFSYGAEGSVNEIPEAEEMLYVMGKLYKSTGTDVSEEVEKNISESELDSPYVGVVQSVVEGSEIPTAEYQANFGDEGAEIVFYGSTIAVKTEGVWTEFVPYTSELSDEGTGVEVFTMEMLIALCHEGSESLQQAFTLEEEQGTLPYRNAECVEYQGSLTWDYMIPLEHEGREYRLYATYWVAETAKEYGEEPNGLSNIRLSYPETDDGQLLYDSDERYIPNLDVESFLQRKYDIGEYVEVELPKGLTLGAYSNSMDDVWKGCLFEGEFAEPVHGEYISESRYAPGGIGFLEMEHYPDYVYFENGVLQRVDWLMNHGGRVSGYETLEDCDRQAILCEYEFDLFTAAEAEEYRIEHDIEEGKLQTTSRYWYVFFAEQDSDYLYSLFLNQEYFSKDEIVDMAKTMKFTR